MNTALILAACFALILAIAVARGWVMDVIVAEIERKRERDDEQWDYEDSIVAHGEPTED